ncbi:MAG: FHA domain-containing protein [Fimbriimonas sp.]
MTDNTETEPIIEEAEDIGQHPHAGVSQEGYSSPLQDAQIAAGCVGQLVLKRHGAETDIVFPVNPPAVIGRFDPSVGPIDVDLGSLEPEGSYVSRKHAKIICDEDVWKIVDLGSSNGTFLLRDDFERVEEGDLADGTEIALGNARFVFHLINC